jgi:2-C-methyl-D-erythritol 4-phosphate cytidylyltransferase
MNTAIIVAAGSGQRVGGDTPKQFLEIHGKPIIIHTLERFEKCALVDEIVLVLAKSKIGGFLEVVSKYGFTKPVRIIEGGETRSDSVYNGLDSIVPDSAGIVVIHDGARPLVTDSEISRTILKAKETGAACLVCEVTDTIKEVCNETIIQTIDRRKLRRAMTPQCFEYELIKRAFSENDVGELDTDECRLVEKLGHDIAIVEGSVRNIKVTRAEDLIFVENALDEN